MKPLTSFENKIKSILESTGYLVRDWDERNACDSLNTFYTQMPFLNYFLDFALPHIKIALEVDGWHHKRTNQKIKDLQKNQDLTKQGWKIIRIRNNSINKFRLEKQILAHYDI